MILKLLDKIGRKKIVLDRGPSHPKYNEAKPWMNRYYVLLRHRPKWFPFNILIHEMLADDHGDGVHVQGDCGHHGGDGQVYYLTHWLSYRLNGYISLYHCNHFLNPLMHLQGHYTHNHE